MKRPRIPKTERRTKFMLIGVALIVMLMMGLSRVFLVKTAADDFDMGPDVNCAVVVEFYGYNNDERVAIPMVNAPWEVNDVILTALGVKVSWTASGQYVKWDTLSIWGSVKFYRLDYYGLNPTDITSNVGFSLVFTRGGIDAKISSVDYNIDLSSLLSGVAHSYSDPDKTYWTIKAVIIVYGEVTSEYDDTIYEANTGELSATYNIYDAEAGLTLSGGIQ